jgi:hypothetical protein
MASFWVVALCRLVSVYHHGTTQKTTIFVLTVMRTSDPLKNVIGMGKYKKILMLCKHILAYGTDIWT